MRVLPLGTRAPFIQEVRGNLRQEVDPPEGSLPPREIVVGIPAPEGAEKKPEEKRMHLRLGEVSEAVAQAAYVRMRSTVINGLKIPLETFLAACGGD